MWSPDETTFCRKLTIAPVAINLSPNGRPSKYWKSTAKGFNGAGYIHSFTISPMMSHSFVSKRKNAHNVCNYLMRVYYDKLLLTLLYYVVLEHGKYI